MRLPSLPPSAPPFGNAATRALGRAVLRVTGFRVEGAVPDLTHCVAIAAPHTSNFDLPLALAAMFALGVRVNWLGKHTIFWRPLGTLLRWLGGVPVDRSAATNTVDQAVAALRAAPRMFLGVAPEGTRSRVARWKTGFHRIAVTAGVPIVPVCLDYSRRVVRIFPTMTPPADLQADIAALQQLYAAGMGRHPGRYGQ